MDIAAKYPAGTPEAAGDPAPANLPPDVAALAKQQSPPSTLTRERLKTMTAQEITAEPQEAVNAALRGDS